MRMILIVAMMLVAVPAHAIVIDQAALRAGIVHQYLSAPADPDADLLIGNSHVQRRHHGWPVIDGRPIAAFGVGGMSVAEARRMMVPLVSRWSASQRVMVWFGIKDFKHATVNDWRAVTDRAVRLYVDLFTRMRAVTPAELVAIMPAPPGTSDILVHAWMRFRSQVKIALALMDGVRVIDFAPIWKTAKGTLAYPVVPGDGHLSDEGYDIIQAALTEALEPKIELLAAEPFGEPEPIFAMAMRTREDPMIATFGREKRAPEPLGLMIMGIAGAALIWRIRDDRP